jgi:hypothetical protein
LKFRLSSELKNIVINAEPINAKGKKKPKIIKRANQDSMLFSKMIKNGKPGQIIKKLTKLIIDATLKTSL